MRTKIFLLLILAPYGVDSFAQAWTRQYGTASIERAASVSADPSGIYVAGIFDGTFRGLVNQGQNDIFIERLTSTGAVLWIKQLATDSDEKVNSIFKNSTGLYVAGETHGKFIPAPSNPFTVVRDNRMFLAKYDENGNRIWVRQFGTSHSPHNEEPTAVAANTSAVYVAGYTRGDLAGVQGLEDAFVRKYDLNGVHRWTRQFGTAGIDKITGIWLHSSGIYVAGFTTGDFSGGTATTSTRDFFVRKYDEEGNIIWTQQKGFAGYDHVNSISGNASGIYLVGETEGAPPGSTNAGRHDVNLHKYTLNGTYRWTKSLGSTMTDHGKSVTANEMHIFITGFVGTTFPGMTSAGEQDAFVYKYDVNGNQISKTQFGSLRTDEGVGIALSQSEVIVVGSTNGSLTPAQGNIQWDYFARKYSSTLVPVWTIQRSSPGVDKLLDITSSDTEGFFVGSTTGNLTNQPVGPGLVLYKFKPNGFEDWRKQIPSTSTSHAAVAVNENNIYLGGENFLNKYDKLIGTQSWNKTINGILDDLTADATNIYGVGSVISGSNQNAALIKFNNNGFEVWRQLIATPYLDEAYSVALDGNDIYVGGLTLGTLPGQTAYGSGDAFISKYAGDGTHQWTKQFGTNRFDATHGIATYGSTVYASGRATGVLAGETDLPVIPVGQYPGGFVKAFDTDGNTLWTKQLGARYGAGRVFANASGVFVAGEYTGDPESKIYLRQYDHAGNLKWSTHLLYFEPVSGSNASKLRAFWSDGTKAFVGGETVGQIKTLRANGNYDAERSGFGGWDMFLARINFPGNTTLGNNSIANFDAVTITFDEVTNSGNTAIVSTDVNPYPDANFYLQGTFFDVESTATFNGDNTICITYDDTDIPSFTEQDLKLYHYENGEWIDATLPGYPDVENNIICGQFTSLSWFAVGVKEKKPDVIKGIDPKIVIGLLAALFILVTVLILRRKLRKPNRTRN